MTVSDVPAASYQSLYRRFRPQRFDEVLGQQHVSLALGNAVRDGRVGHAYLFSGPRGTGKTSTARILAKALNCAAPRDGEPCGTCDSCVEISRGTSMDVHELDAASNNGVDAMRELVAHSALGTPGRWKVYIVDEVHMLSTAASNALLKTLEEPPPHVVFVLATTDAQRVLPTIRSRTQHFEFRLLGPEVLSGLLQRVREEAALDVDDDALDSAIRRGRGSARDALSALDQVAAGGAVRDEIATLAEMADALAERDAGRVLVEVAKAANAGHDAARLAGELADYLRQGFLAVLSPDLVSIAGAERARVDDVARRMGLPALVRAMEALGRSVVDMRDTPDPRVHLEATLVRLAHPDLDDSPAALLERVERLERALSSGSPPGQAGPVRTADAPPPPEGSPPPTRASERTSRRSGAPAHGAQQEAEAPAARPEQTRPRPGGARSDATPAGSDTTASQTRGTGANTDRASPLPGDGAGGATGPALARRALSDLRQGRRATAGGPGDSNPRAPGSANAPGGPSLTGSAPEGLPGAATATGPARASATGVAEPTARTTEPTAVSSPGETGKGTVTAAFPSRDDLAQVWGDGLLASLPPRARVRYRVGRFVATEAGAAVFALPNETHRSYCEEVRAEVESALGARLGTAVPLVLVVDDESSEEGPSSPAGRRGAPARSASPGTGRSASERPADVPRHADQTVRAPGHAEGAGRPADTGRGPDEPSRAGTFEQDAEPDLLDPAVFASETEPAGAGPTPEQRIKLAFPGAEEV